MIVLTAQADVQKTTLAETPAVPLQVGAEIELRALAERATVLGLLRRHPELQLLRGDDGFGRPEVCAEVPRHRTEMTARADQHPRADAPVREPSVALPLERAQRLAQLEPRAAAAEQIVIELEAPDAVAHRPRVVGIDLTTPQESGSKTGDGLKHAPAPVVLDVELQRLHDRRRDPPGADLVARKGALVHHDHVDAGPREGPGAGRSGRTATDDQHLARNVWRRVTHRGTSRRA